ncbi:MAG: Asp-tRNA(Asn)/Glu-tRNA(Gln) amidotransferase subunit GatA, partial [Pedobacter sp.]
MTLYRSFSSVQAAIKSGSVTCRQLVEQYLVRIDEYSHLNVFTEVYDVDALQQANTIDQKLAAGTAGRLAGMVIGIKDVLSYA